MELARKNPPDRQVIFMRRGFLSIRRRRRHSLAVSAEQGWQRPALSRER